MPVESAGELGDEEVTVTVDEVPEGLGVLVVKRGPNAGSRFVLEAEVTRAGRHPDSDIFLDDITVSRRHAEFARTGSVYRCATSARSTAPTSTGSASRQAELHGGDEVQIGKFRLVFLAGIGEG